LTGAARAVASSWFDAGRGRRCVVTKAYVLITTEIGKGDDVYEALSRIDGVSAVNIVAGTYDVVAVLEAADAREIGRLVMGPIQKIDGVMSTVTLMAIR
jgi:DNA-binding Lrp family transcriptional regulator